MEKIKYYNSGKLIRRGRTWKRNDSILKSQTELLVFDIDEFDGHT